jgi:drug/metabolite transporter (DMT)-like permease
MKQKNKSLLEIHIAVLLFGLAGLFGKFISLPADLIVLGRAGFAALILAGVIYFSKNGSFKLHTKKDYLLLLLLGIILAIHWTTFFYSIQVSTVAIGLLTFSTFPVFTTLIEPLVFKEKFKSRDIVIALITLLGVALIVPKIEFGNSATQGALWGITSGFAFAVLSILNRKYVTKYSSLTIAFYQNSSATVVLLPFLFLTTAIYHTKDILLLVLLGVVFTAASHTLFIKGMTHIKAQLASIIASLEPVYGIVFAIPLLGEIPNARTILGGVIILTAAFIASNDMLATKLKTKSQ